MEFDSSYNLLRPRGPRYHAKWFFYCLFVKLTPWWPEFQECRRIRQKCIREMGITKQEFRQARQLLRVQ